VKTGKVLRLMVAAAVTLWIVSNYAAAQSVLSIWTGPGSTIEVGNYTVTLYSVNSNGYTTLGISKNGENQTIVMAGPNGSVWVGTGPNGYSLRIGGWIITNSTSYVRLVLRGSYLHVGETLRVGKLRMKLLSVSPENATLLINGRKRTISGSAEISGYRLTVVPMPELFSGYLRLNTTEEAGGVRIRVLGRIQMQSGSTLLAGVKLILNNETYRVPLGRYIPVSGRLVRVTSISRQYAGVEVEGYGAYIDLLGPGREVTVPAGTTVYGRGYALVVGGVEKGGVNVTLIGQKRCNMFLIPHHGLTCGGVTVGVLGILRGSRPRVRLVIVGAGNESTTESTTEPTIVRWLNVSVRGPEKAIAGEPFNVTVELYDAGDLPVRHLTVTAPETNSLLIRPSSVSIENLGPGERRTLRFEVTALRPGPAILGPFEVRAVYQDGTATDFMTRGLILTVKPPRPRLRVEVRAGTGRVGTEIPVVVTIRNEMSFPVRFNLTVSIPDGSAVAARGFSIYGRWLWRSCSVGGNGSVNYTLTFVPTRAGSYRITAVAESYGRTFSGFSTMRVSQIKPEVKVIKESCKPKVITRIIRYNESTEERSSGWRTGIAVGSAFAAGAGFVLFLAWIAAKLEERKEGS